MSRFIFNLLFFFGFLASANGWERDYISALKRCQEEKKCLLLFFTGSDWSGLSMKMKREILESDEFIEMCKNRLIALEVDFPQHKALECAKKQENILLQDKHKIREFPALVLLNEEGKEIIKLEYFPESGRQLAENLINSIENDRRLAKELQKLGDANELRTLHQIALELGQKEAAEKIVAEGVKRNDSFFLLENYRILVEQEGSCSQKALALYTRLKQSPDCQIQYTLAMIAFQELAKSCSTAEAIQPLVEYLSKYGNVDKENVWRIEMMIAQCMLEKDEWEKSLHHAQMAYQTAPKEMKEEIRSSIEYIERCSHLASHTN